MIDFPTRERRSRYAPGRALDLLVKTRLGLVALLLLPVLHGCSAETDRDIGSRTLARIDAALDDGDLPADLLARQHRLFEVLAENRIDELPQYLDLEFRFNDVENPAPAAAAVGSAYLPSWRERGGLNYYQFLARDIPEHAWSARTIEIVWIVPRVALVVAHHDETDPVFTQWEHRADGWKAVRLTINSADATLQQARDTRRRNR